MQQYEEALKTAGEAVAKNPTNSQYRSLLEQVQDTAARYEYNIALRYYGKNQLSRALESIEKAVAYKSDFEEARQAYLQVKARLDLVDKVVTEIPSLIANGRPDEALARIQEVQPYASDFPQIRNLKIRALEQSTLLHSKQGLLALQEADYESARNHFQVALNRSPGYPPAVDGLSRANAQLKAQNLVGEGKSLLAQERYSQAYRKFEEALGIVPGHAEAAKGLSEVAARWGRALYRQGEELEAQGDFDSMAEALRSYERAGRLTSLSPETSERVEALKRALAGEFRMRGQEYEQLGEDYHGLAVINYQMSLYCDPKQVELSRRAVTLKEAFDNRRAFYIDIRSEADSSAGATFTKQLTQTLKTAVIESGIKDLYVVAPFDRTDGGENLSSVQGLSGRHLTIFTSLLSEPVIVRGENRPETVQSNYRLGTRFVPNPAYDKGRRAVIEARAEEKDVEQEYERLLEQLRRVDDEDERDSLLSEIEFQRALLDDAEDATIEAERILAATAEQTEEEVFQPYEYLSYTVTMEAKVEVSLEVADPYKGATRTIEVIKGSTVAADAYTEGVEPTDSQGAVTDPKELPTQSELLAEARGDAVTNAVEWLKGALGELSLQYYNRAKELLEIGNIERAAEYYYAFYLSTPERESPEALEAIEFVRRQTHLITPDERSSTGKNAE